MTRSSTSPKSTSPIVIFGGTFNPIHYGHLSPVIDAATKLGAEQLIYLPCNIPPHKASPSVTSAHRFEMVKLAVNAVKEQIPHNLTVTVSNFEISKTDTSYTRYTIEHFASTFPNNELYFLIGMDSLLHFNQWFKWQEILEYCRLLVVQRPGYEQRVNELPDQILEKTTFIDTQQIDVSSTEIRSALSESSQEKASNLLTLLPKCVQQYVRQHKLY